MRLGRQSAERHRGRDKPAADRLRGLDLLERDWGTGPEREQIPRARRHAGCHPVAEGVVRLLRVRRDRGVHRPHQLGRPAVIFAVPAIAHPPVVGQHRLRGGLDRGIRRSLPRQHILGDLGEADAADGRRGPGEAAVDHFGTEPERLEDLGAAVGRQRRDPHLREDLAETRLGGGAEPGPGILFRHVRFHGLDREPGVHAFRAIADERREMMHVPGVAGLDDQSHAGAHARLEEVLVHRADRQQRRHRCALAVGSDVAEDHDPRPVVHCQARRPAQPVERRPQRIGTSGGCPCGVERNDLGAHPAAERSDLLREQHGVLVPHEPQSVGPVDQE